MTRNTILVAAIVAALGLGAALWFVLEPGPEQETAAAAPQPRDANARPGTAEQNQSPNGQAPSSQTAAADLASEPAAAPEQQTAAAEPVAEPVASAPAAAAPAASAPAASAPAASAPAAAAPTTGIAAPQPPSFDIVRVEKDGSAVIAGRAPAGSSVTLFDGERALGSAKAEADGSFALVLDAPLDPGSRALSLAATTPDGTTVPSAGEVVVVVPEPAQTAAASQPADSGATTTGTASSSSTPTADSATTGTASGETTTTTADASGTASSTGTTGSTASEPAASGTTATTGTTETAAAEQPAVQPTTPLVVASGTDGASVVLQAPGDLAGDTLRIAAVDYDPSGQVVISGNGPAKGAVALYLDDALLGQSTADETGRWVFKPTSPVAAGLHRLRADLLAADGTVAGRAEIPFSRAEPIQVAANEDFVVVQPGNSLWVIARGKYGEGVRYAAIYEANAGQIRNPDLIYPGQIFLVPQVN